MNHKSCLGLFQGFGIELEYMIVDRASLSVLPVSDQVLRDIAGAYVNEVEVGEIAWSNELVMHVIELKTNGPATSLAGLPVLFQRDIVKINALLEPHGGRLMPTAMHPWMNPHRETRLWPHSDNAIYEAFDRIFDCQGHGWSNVQSTHINLPFADDREFGQLHAAIRLILPLLPALAASSPAVEGRLNGMLDTRMEYYRTNARRIPSVTGKVIPEPLYTRNDYETKLLQTIYNDLAPYDPKGILQYEWANARGAIARFDRNTIEIRVLDVQECPLADLAIAAAIVSVIKDTVDERWLDLAAQQQWGTDALESVLRRTIVAGENAMIDDSAYLAAFGFQTGKPVRASVLWRHLIDSVADDLNDQYPQWLPALQLILNQGTLASRITNALAEDTSSDSVAKVYKRLCDCLAVGTLFSQS